MVKTFKKSTAFISAAVMFMTMLLYFPSGIFSNIQWGLSASAATVELSEPKEGNGSSDSPYKIGTAAELYWFAACVNGTDGVTQNRAACAKLTEDIFVNKEFGEFNDDGTVNAYTWTPIGNSYSNQYTGTFDGQEHTISGLYFNDTSTSCVGLFGYNKGTIKNVGVVDSDFKGFDYVSGVCGYNKGTITNCYNSGTVSSSSYVGGVCGRNLEGTITSCHNEANVSGSTKVGGVCGYNISGTITNCQKRHTVSGANDVGGVCGAK